MYKSVTLVKNMLLGAFIMDISYKLYSDSTCDLSKEILDTMDVKLFDLAFEVDGKTYIGDQMSLPDFYAAMRKGAMTKTSQVSPQTYEEEFEKCINAGFDILHLGSSSGLSGSYQAACIAKDNLLEKYPKAKIVIVDSLCASTGQGLLLIKADRLRREGMGLDELGNWLEENRLHTCHVFTVDDLEYLRRGGRVSKTAAVAGSILGIKPILHVDNEGHLIPLGKVRGRRQSLDKLIELIKERYGDWDNSEVCICHGDSIDDAKYCADKMRGLFGKNIKVNICYTGAVIGAHSGPGTIALFFMGEHR